jgi:uncharacterized membrane protein YcaP (DUF421 family)
MDSGTVGNLVARLQYRSMNLWHQLWDPVREFLGLSAPPETLTFLQISIRGIIVFIFTLIMVRMSARRNLARRTVFDSIFLVILASVLARAINGSSDLLPTIGGGFVMVAFHRLLAWIAFYSHRFGNLIKGVQEPLIGDGNLMEPAMRHNHITTHDLEEDLRLSLHTEDLGSIRRATLERSGGISFIRK